MSDSNQDDTAPTPKWLTITEACKYLEISEQTMFRWMRSGKITYYKVGKSTRFKEEDLDKAVDRVASKSFVPEDPDTCHICGNPEMISGTLSALGELVFKPEKSKFSIWKDSSISVSALCCTKCGNITLKANPEDFED